MNVFQYYSRADAPHLQGFRRIQATDPAHTYAANWWPSGHIIGYEHLFVHELYEFIKCLNSKKTTYSTFEDAVSCQRVLEAVEKSCGSRKWTKV
jgi:predicted dehydrogenase